MIILLVCLTLNSIQLSGNLFKACFFFFAILYHVSFGLFNLLCTHLPFHILLYSIVLDIQYHQYHTLFVKFVVFLVSSCKCVSVSYTEKKLQLKLLWFSLLLSL